MIFILNTRGARVVHFKKLIPVTFKCFSRSTLSCSFLTNTQVYSFLRSDGFVLLCFFLHTERRLNLGDVQINKCRSSDMMGYDWMIIVSSLAIIFDVWQLRKVEARINKSYHGAG